MIKGGISNQRVKNKLPNKYNWEMRYPGRRKCSEIPVFKNQMAQNLKGGKNS